MSLRLAVEQVFAQHGSLAQSLSGFAPRPDQSTMALHVAQIMEEGGTLVVEAGTGIGKTFAYLVPALLSGQRVLLSTATKTLQDQLFGRDIPRLSAALGVVVRVALLKGRSSYLCHQRMYLAREDAALQPNELFQLARVVQWAQVTKQGDLAELPELDEDSALIPKITSTRENCWGGRCPQHHRCCVNQARKNALEADLVVVNHHLFFADLQVRESGVAELLPSVNAVIFDEAHQLNDIGVQFLGRQFSTHQILDLGRDMLKAGMQLARGWVDWPGLHLAIQQAVQGLMDFCFANDGAILSSERMQWGDSAPAHLDAEGWGEAVIALQHTLYSVVAGLELVAASAPELQQLHTRSERLLQALVYFFQPTLPDGVRWLELGATHARFFESPLHIAHALQTQAGLKEKVDGAKKAWIFTSATLGLDKELSSFVQMCGLQQATVLQLASPFDYAHQAALYIPQDMPLPHEAGHSVAVAQLVAAAAQVLGGRTLVLTTTLRAMNVIAEQLRSKLSPHLGINVLLQGEMPKRALLQLFTSASEEGSQGSILVASTSFWEGVDVPGRALQLVVMDKIPFAPPDDPLVQARAKSLELSGKSAFMHYHVPHAALALKQGAGRLIRTETDRGVLVICDVRLEQKGYGRKLLAALPAMRRLANMADFNQALQALTTASTTDRC